jgi:hypothetical protein
MSGQFCTDVLGNEVCRTCHRTKPLEEFARDSNRPSRYRTQCSDCRTDYDRERRYTIRSWRYGFLPIIGTVTTPLLIERYGDRCFHCPTGSFESIDHLVCVRVGGGHTIDNVVPCCKDCNIAKRWTVDEQAIRQFSRHR